MVPELDIALLIETNLTGPLYCVRQVARHMMAHTRGGKITDTHLQRRLVLGRAGVPIA